MVISLECDLCKENIRTSPYIYAHCILTNSNPIKQHEYWEACICLKAVCHNCGNVIYAQKRKELTNSDIEELCLWDEKRA